VAELPGAFLNSLKNVEGFNREAFEKVHQMDEQITSIRTNPAKSIDEEIKFPFETESSVPWSIHGHYLKKRPSFTFDPLFHAGLYYVQEASSMFLEQAFRQLVNAEEPIKVLDLCAAPGGKSTHIQSLISADSLLVSNEVIKSRSNVLVDNIIKWGAKNILATNNDPAAFQKLEGFFDVMVVDAPCSGSGLFRKDENAIDEWSLNNVQLCSHRQQRILANALPALKENGMLIYSTCSYSKEEDEDIADWLVEEMEMENIELKIDDNWNIVKTFSAKISAVGYRFYPDKLKGEGLFMACFKKNVETREPKIRPAKIEKVTAKERAIIEPCLKEKNLELLKEKEQFFILPSSHVNDYSVLRSVLNVQYRGVGIGQVMNERLVPDHSLALSTIVSDEIPVNDLSYDQSIKYLQRQDMNFNSSGKGWQLIRYKSQNLGWINVLPNRINNYYPKELRILKQVNDSSFEK
jgi:16S rRNA C967 or C1407 C5-methylase (RsmB/RsmF family)/NOL1/NOP2/fmu family ribosome biogenesis protein